MLEEFDDMRQVMFGTVEQQPEAVFVRMFPIGSSLQAKAALLTGVGTASAWTRTLTIDAHFVVYIAHPTLQPRDLLLSIPALNRSGQSQHRSRNRQVITSGSQSAEHLSWGVSTTTAVNWEV